MENWKRAVIAGSVGAATLLLLKGKRPAAVLVGGVGLAVLASEYPDQFAKIREELPSYVRQGAKFLDLAMQIGGRIEELADCLLYTSVVARQGSPQVQDSLRGSDCAGDRLAHIDRHQFLRFGGRAGSFSDHAFAGRSSAVGAVSVRVCGAAEVCFWRQPGGRALQSRHADCFRIVRLCDHGAGNRIGVFSGQADYLGLEV